jgi:hypothetical protein
MTGAVSKSDVHHYQGPISSSSASPEMLNATRPGLVFEITDQDVLLGRGTGPNESQGNIRFRALVRHALQDGEASRLDGRVKAKLAREILKAVKSENGRFLKINSDGSSATRSFSIVPDNVALDKIKQSFRHQLRVLEDAMSKRKASTSGSLDDGASPVATNPQSSSSSYPTSQFQRQTSMTPSLGALLNPSNSNDLRSTPNMNVGFARDNLEKEAVAKVFAASAAARRTMRESALSNALMLGDPCLETSPMTELINALATAKAKAALRQASSMSYMPANYFGGLAPHFRRNQDPSLVTGNSMMMATRLASPTGRSPQEGLSFLRDLESRIAEAMAVVTPKASDIHHQSLLLNNSPHYLDMILRRAT